MSDLSPFDASNFPTTEPDYMIIGQFYGWKLPYTYDDQSFSMQYELHRIGSTNVDPIVITGAAQTIDGVEYWTFEVDSDTSTQWGEDGHAIHAEIQHRYDLVLISGTNRVTLQTGLITIFPSSADRRTHAEVMLSKIESILEGRADHDVSSYSIKSRSITRMTVEELTYWRDYYRSEIRATGGSTSGRSARTPNTLRVRFTDGT
jgi:hypothetical protein